MVYFLMLAALLVILGTSALILTIAYVVWRPHRTKGFFSYSHKDTPIAERIMDRLKTYNFRVYIDFGLEIQAEDLEKELNNAIRKRDIFILLASKNSADSYWVQFEINRAEQMDDRVVSQRRDMVFLAIDDKGIQIAERLRLRNERRMRDFWNSEIGFEEKLAKESPDEQARMKASLKKGRSALALFPFLRRILLPEFKIFDFRRPFETVMIELEEYLKNSTRFFGAWLNLKHWAPITILVCLVLILFFGFVVSIGMLLVLLGA